MKIELRYFYLANVAYVDMKKMKIPILYEDKDIVAIDKPAGLVVHPDGKTKEPALTDWIIEKYPKTKNVGEPIEIIKDGIENGIIERPGIVQYLFCSMNIPKLRYYINVLVKK
jgi:23S rRNA-/tRNA-specific pseudouridylate synthase